MKCWKSAEGQNIWGRCVSGCAEMLSPNCSLKLHFSVLIQILFVHVQSGAIFPWRKAKYSACWSPLWFGAQNNFHSNLIRGPTWADFFVNIEYNRLWPMHPFLYLALTVSPVSVIFGIQLCCFGRLLRQFPSSHSNSVQNPHLIS